jgi:PIN domain nuclease of toxin-antitoxin system
VNLLLDTHVLIWALDRPERLPPALRAELENADVEVYFSATSIWEISIKTALGKIDFPHSPLAITQGAIATGFIELPITALHAAKVADLPAHHRDPFDRLLIAQALALPAYLLTVDRALAVYSDLIRCV